MPDGLGRSVYLASFGRQRPELERNAGTGAQVFLSLHMGEEFAPDYCRRAEGMCRWLQEAGFRTIADVSVKTVEQFGQPDLVRLARRLGLWALRVDYGLSWDEIAALACELPVAQRLNHSAGTGRPHRPFKSFGNGAAQFLSPTGDGSG